MKLGLKRPDELHGMGKFQSHIYVDVGRSKSIQLGCGGVPALAQTAVIQSDVSDQCRSRRSGAEPRPPVVSGLAPVICKYESVMDKQKREVRHEEMRKGSAICFGARLKMAGLVDLQGFCSQNLVNISEALMVY